MGALNTMLPEAKVEAIKKCICRHRQYSHKHWTRFLKDVEVLSVLTALTYLSFYAAEDSHCKLCPCQQFYEAA